MRGKTRIASASEILQQNIENVVQVGEWARLMGYECPKKFARQFLRHYSVRPQTYLKYLRLKHISTDLRNENRSNFEVARKYGIPDEIALNKFINYHLNCSPTDLKSMPQNQLEERVEKLGSNIR